MEKKEWKNGYGDGSGKGTITYGDEGVLRVHWGCSCCDGFNEDTDKDLIRFAKKVAEILNKEKFVPRQIAKRLKY